jgi:hypothetical protein
MDKLGRNDKCYCGSGKKYKICCLNTDNNKKETELLNMENGHESINENIKLVYEFMSLKYSDHKVIDISNYITPQNYNIFQTKHFKKKLIMIVGKNLTNTGLFQIKGIENADTLIMYRGSYRIFNFNNLLQVEESIDKMMKTRSEWKVDNGG